MKVFLKKKWPLLGLVLLVAVVGYYFIKAGKAIVAEPMLRDILSGEGVKLRDIHYTQDDPDAATKWVLDAEEVRFSGDESLVFFENFRLLIQPENRSSIELTGKSGVYARDKGVIELSGNIVARSGNGYRAVTESIQIHEKTGKLQTDKPIKIAGPFFSVEGTGLFADLKKETGQILSGVTTTFKGES